MTFHSWISLLCHSFSWYVNHGFPWSLVPHPNPNHPHHLPHSLQSLSLVPFRISIRLFVLFLLVTSTHTHTLIPSHRSLTYFIFSLMFLSPFVYISCFCMIIIRLSDYLFFFFLDLLLVLSVSLSLTFTHTHSLLHTHSLSFAHPPTHTQTHTHTFFLVLAFSGF